MQDRALYAIQEARKLLGRISRNTIYKLLRTGELASVVIACRRFISSAAIAEFIANIPQTTSNIWAAYRINRGLPRRINMKFALVNGQRQEARPNLSGKCPNPNCDRQMVAKCGEVKIWHWAHQGRRFCDSWWENETEWHRAWKDQFPSDWQEVVHHAETGEKHISDVKTDRGWVIEFQHSYLKPEERRSRDTFYRKLIWVVDGTRRKKDRAQLLHAWEEGVRLGTNSPVRKVFFDDCALLREWAGSNAPIFFDVGEMLPLWWSLANSTNGSAYVAPYPRAQFIESHRGAAEIGQVFDQFMDDIPKLVANYESHLRLRR
jgi:competence protein CoiA